MSDKISGEPQVGSRLAGSAYRVQCNRHLRNLELGVNIAISEGWQPLGGISCVETTPDSEPLFTMEKDGTLTPGEFKESTRMWAQALILPNDRSELPERRI
jgi:hypothetical protein